MSKLKRAKNGKTSPAQPRQDKQDKARHDTIRPWSMQCCQERRVHHALPEAKNKPIPTATRSSSPALSSQRLNDVFAVLDISTFLFSFVLYGRAMPCLTYAPAVGRRWQLPVSHISTLVFLFTPSKCRIPRSGKQWQTVSTKKCHGKNHRYWY